MHGVACCRSRDKSGLDSISRIKQTFPKPSRRLQVTPECLKHLDGEAPLEDA